jgi:tetratricopeptide (TPR) repeat protein
MPDRTESLALGLEYHRAGHLYQAEQIYRQILSDDPTNVLALSYLAALYMDQRRFEEAAAHLQRLLELQPHHAETYNELGVARAQQGQPEQAVASFQHALELKPNYPEALNNFGIVLAQQDKLDEASRHYSQALALRLDYPEAHNNLGIVYARQGKPSAAIACYTEALALRPNYAEAHNNLGLVLAEQGAWESAVTRYRQALQFRPDYAEAHYNLGLVLAKMEQLDDAIACYRQALGLKPDYAEAHNNLGVALGNQGQLEESVASFRQAVSLKPDYAEAYYNAGLVLAKSGAALVRPAKLDDAIACYRQALLIKPDHAEAHKDLALAWLLLGNFEQGWPEYEWRWKCAERHLRQLPGPSWDGAPLAGRTILLHAEQGLGDTLQFIRYAPLVRQVGHVSNVPPQHGGKVLVICQQQLLSLLASCPGIDGLLAWESALPDFDVHVPLLSLPGIFGTTLATIPAKVPYLSADPELVERWRRELDGLPAQPLPRRGRESIKVGIAWQGNPEHKQDRQRSLALAHFESLARLPGIRLFSLQVGPGTQQLRDLGGRFPVTDLGSRFDPASFQDAAAVVTVLDLVISVDSAIAHLAGALGIPVWVLLPLVPDWRWMLDRDDSPWYPTMRLFRQREPGDWTQVFRQVVDAYLQFSV